MPSIDENFIYLLGAIIYHKDSKPTRKYLTITKDKRKFYPEIWSFEDEVSDKVVRFMDKVAAERFFDTYNEEITKAAKDIFTPDELEEVKFEVLAHGNADYNVRSLNGFKQPTSKTPLPLTFIGMRLYDKNPDVSEMRFLCISDDHVVQFHREFGLVKIFRNPMEATRFFLDNIDGINDLIEDMRTKGVYKHADVLIGSAEVVPRHYERLEILPIE